MPTAGSQVILCDVPIRFDTYEGCSHACSYCFAQRNRDISKIKMGESVNSLLNFIKGYRDKNTNWCDWDIPLHWGGMSDPFQPIERETGRSLECLRVLAETGYPFVVSTKNDLIAEGEYFELIKRCNCVVQFSAICERYDKLESGASTFAERMKAAKKISAYKRVIVRCQPYMPNVFKDVLQNIKVFKDAGVYGCVFEAMKAQRITQGMIKLGADYVYPISILKPQFEEIKKRLHDNGMKFYSGENRLRQMGDNLCCCGIDGMGWKVNTANLNHYLYDKENYKFTEAQKAPEGGMAFQSLAQRASTRGLTHLSYERCMEMCVSTKSYIETLMPIK